MDNEGAVKITSFSIRKLPGGGYVVREDFLGRAALRDLRYGEDLFAGTYLQCADFVRTKFGEPGPHVALKIEPAAPTQTVESLASRLNARAFRRQIED